MRLHFQPEVNILTNCLSAMALRKTLLYTIWTLSLAVALPLGHAFGQCSITNLNAVYCADDASVALTGGTNYYGPGISGTTFSPASAGAGTHKVYTTDGTTSSYTVNTTGTFSPVTLTSPTTLTIGVSISVPIGIGFNFNFYGNTFSSVRVFDNGFIRFSGTNATPVPQTIPNTVPPNDIVAIAWADLDASTGTIRYQTMGTAPLRVLVIEYNNVQFTNNTSDYVTSQILLYETTNIIEIHSTHIGSDGSAQTMGIENAAGTAAATIASRNNQIFTADNDYVGFFPSCTSVRSVTVNAVPNTSLAVSPATTSICPGATVGVTVANSEVGVNYQLLNSADNTVLSTSQAGTGGNLVLTSSALSSSVTLKVRATNATTSCDSDLTNTVGVTVNAPPAITVPPATQAVCTGSSVTFNVTATGTGLSYQWRKGGSNISGANSSSYTIASTVAGDAGSYDVIVSGTCTPPVTSSAATLTINALPAITAQPVASQAICEGSAANFSVTATGAGLTYQWKKNGIDISGANASTYSIPTTSTSSAGTYTVVVSGTCSPAVTSSASVLTINEQPEIITGPSNQTVCAGQSVTFSVNAGVTTGATYQWRKGGTNISGANSSSYTIATTVAGDAGSYDVIVSGTCTPAVTSSAATLTINALPTITAQPVASQAICEGSAANFSVTATGTSLTYQWKKNGVDISGANASTYSIPTTSTSSAGTYTVVVSGTCSPSVTSSASVLTIREQPEIITGPSNQTVCVGQSVTFSVNAGVTTGVTYQWRKGGSNISGANSSSYTIASTVAGDAGSYDVIVSGTCTPSVTSSAATLTINALPAITAQPVASQAICEGSAANFSVTATGAGLAYQWKKNGVDISGANASTYSIPVTSTSSAGTYTVVVSGTCSPSVTSSASVLTIREQPEIITGPSNQTVCAGQSVTFSVNAGVTTGVTYQWRKGGSNISGANSSSYTIASTVAGDAGSYDVIVSGTCTPSITSSAVTLTINALPTISAQPVASQAICEGSAANFSVTATGTGLTYQWKKDGIDISGANASTYSIPVTSTSSAGTYTVVVSGTCSPSVTSSASVLTIREQPEIITGPSNQTVCAGQSVTFSVNAGVTTGVTYQWRKGGSNISGANSSSYTIASTVAGDAGSYDVVVSGTCTPPVTSSAATLTINALPAITAQPVASQAICEGSAANFSVTATGTGLIYQWKKNGVDIVGANASTYSIPVTSTSSPGTYTVVVSGTCSPSVTSAASVLTIQEQPEIITGPVSQTVCVGQSVTFSVSAGATTGVTYQWRKGGSNIAGANSSTYTIASAVAADAGSYDVIVGGTCTPAVTSSAATLTVNTLPAITAQPVASQAICEGSPASFSVTATGTGITYQWKKNGVDISGANASTYTIPTTVTADAGTYTVVVSGTCSPSVTSSTSVLTIREQPEIITGPASQTVCAGQSVTFSVNAGVTTGVTYQWRKDGSNISGANSSSYTIPATVAGDAGDYDVVISGTCTPPVTSSAATLIINALPAITAQPVASQAICEGSAANFSVTATGTGLAYQWKKNGVDISGANANTYSIASTSASDAGTYTVVVSGTCSPSVTSTASILTIQEQPEIITGPSSQTVCAGQNVTFTVNAGVTTGVTYQWRKGGTNIAGATSSSYTITGTVAGDAGNYDVVISGTCTPPVTSSAATLIINALPAITAQPVASQAICEGSAANFSVTATGTGLTYQWKKNGVDISGANANTYSIASSSASDAGTYTVVVSGTCSPSVTSTASILTIQEQPEIITGPSSQTVCAGQNVTFTVNAGVTTGVTYQWRKDGTNIAGANSNSYTITGVVVGDAGDYDVVVSGTCTPSITTSAATLTINELPAITAQPIASQAICEGSAATFSVTATGTALTYQWKKNGVDIAGANASTYTISTTITADAGTYTVVVSGACSPVVTSTASVLTIQEQPEIITGPVGQTVCAGQSVTFSVNAGVTTGVTYQWRKDGTNIAGANGSSYTITSTVAGDAGDYDVVITGTCTPPATSSAATLIVNPNPDAYAADASICSGTTTNIAITNPNGVSGTTFTWTVQSTSNVTGAAAGSGNLIAQALTVTNGVSTGSVTYLIQPAAAGCNGIAYAVNVTVKPIPTVAASDQSICSGNATSVAITNPNGVAGTSFSWTVQSTSNVSGAAAGSGSTIGQVLTTTDGINAGSVVYRIVPTANGCSGNYIDVTVTVEPKPTITNPPTTLIQEICSGTALNFLPTSSITGTTFNWTSSVIGTLSGVSASGSGAITDTPVNATNTNAVIIYTITPSVGGCSGTPVNLVVTVRPLPTVTANPQTICSGQTTSIAISNPNGVTGTTYTWIVQGSSNVSGASAGSGSTISQALTNVDGVTNGTVTYRITASSNGCPGAPYDVTVTVKPVPVVTNDPIELAQQLCSGQALNFIPTASIAGASFTWTSSITGPITSGVTASGAGSITDTPVNTGNVSGTVTYRIIPNHNGCDGQAVNLVVLVKPLPSASANDITICSGETAVVTILPSPQNVSGTTFQWTAAPTTNVIGAANGNGSVISQILSTSNASIGTVVYTILPSANGCDGPTSTVTVTVNPKVTVNAGADFAVCEDATMPMAIPLNGTIGGSASSANWFIKTGDGSVSVSITSGGSVTATYTAVDSDVTNGFVELYLVTDDPDGVSGPCSSLSDTLTIFLNRRARILPLADQVVCEPSLINLSGDISGSATSGSWSAVTTAGGTLSISSVTGNTITANYGVLAADVGNTLTFRLSTNDPDGAGPCTIVTEDLDVHINESAKVSAGADFEVCEDKQVNLNGSFSGTTSSVTWSGGSGSAQFADVNNPTTVYTLTSADRAAGSIVLTLTTNDPDGVSGPCTSVSDDVLVKVNPLPQPLIFGLESSYAENDAPDPLSGVPSGAGYSGVFTGSGIQSGTNIFDPSIATIGFNTIYYTVTNTTTGCIGVTSATTVVNPITDIDFTIEDAIEDGTGALKICAENGLKQLIGIPAHTTGFPTTEFTSLTAGLTVNLVDENWYVNTDNVIAGSYFVKYTYTNGLGATSEFIRKIVVYAAPRAIILTNNACVTDAAKFASISDIPNNTFNSKIIQYLWNFDFGGLTSADSATSLVYNEPGIYDVVLTVTTDEGCSDNVTHSIQVGPQPKVDFDWTKICSGQTTQFVDKSSISLGSIVQYGWDFDDGDVLPLGNKDTMVPPDPRTSNTYNNPHHKYASFQAYNVTLSVKTDVGCLKDTTRQIYIVDYNQPVSDNGYETDFEAGQGTWIRVEEANQQSSWIFGAVDGQNINQAYSGTNAWWTGGNTVAANNYISTYYPNEQSYVIGPCVNLEGLKRPMVALKYWSDSDKNFDGAVLQYSSDGGRSWETVGTDNGEGIEWYNGSDLSGEPGGQDNYAWTGTTSGWKDARFNLNELPKDTVVFRIAFGSNSDNNPGTVSNGFAFDDIYIGEKNRNVLIEHYTNDGSSSFQLSEEYIDELPSNDFIKLQYHLESPGLQDAINAANPIDNNARAQIYGIRQPPATIMDGILNEYYGKDFNGFTGNITTVDIDRRSLEDPSFDITIDIDGTTAADVLKADIQYTFIDKINSFTPPVILQAALVENGVNGNKFSMRKLLYGPEGFIITDPLVAGTSVTYSKPDAEETHQLATPIANGDSLYIIAFAQDKQTRRILQSVIMKVEQTKASQTPVGIPDDPAVAALQDLKIYPNPASQNIKLYLGDKLNRDYTWKLIDQRGITILNGDVNRDLTSPQLIDVTRIANGIYFMAIQTGDRSVLYTKIAVMNQN
ncbi:immunoglobulin domain-containing protein [Ohtaekwangia kribbensis]|uniref:Immunoglobulin domain-containing protein n=1 Tax=Ohtaekwangia kribbensis TaxID=688913 RepID=A0ABW3JVY1_9BACT